MIYALGTPVNARCRPWQYEWAIKPDALMISAIDFLTSPRTYQRIKEQGIYDYLDWDGKLICDSGAFSALNRKKKIHLDVESLKVVYQELNEQDPSILKITLDYPDEAIVSNYHKLHSLEVQPVLPYNNLTLAKEIIRDTGNPEWFFIGRLVPLMRGGGGHAKRLFPILEEVKKYIQELGTFKIWALGCGAPSLLHGMSQRVEGCDSARWRVTGSNMILLPHGGERGIGRKTKWRGTHHRIANGKEKDFIILILSMIDNLSGGLESLDIHLQPEKYPKRLDETEGTVLPKIGILLSKLRNAPDEMTVYDLELIFRTSGTLRLVFNYWSALAIKSTLIESLKRPFSYQKILDF